MSHNPKKKISTKSSVYGNPVKLPEPVYVPLVTPDDILRVTGRGNYTFTFKEIKDNNLVLTLSGYLYTLLIPPHWKDVELLEPGCSVDVNTNNKSLIPSLRDAKGSVIWEEPNRIRFLFLWRGRTWLMSQNLPDQYYTVYSVLADKMYTGYDPSGVFTILEMPIPFREVGYAPLLEIEEGRQMMRGMPFMCKKDKNNN